MLFSSFFGKHVSALVGFCVSFGALGGKNKMVQQDFRYIFMGFTVDCGKQALVFPNWISFTIIEG